jgi:hypothetical protein
MSESPKLQEATLISANWQHFFAGFICSALFPLLPLIIEFGFSGTVTDNTILISAIMYCSAIALTSDSVLIFVLGFLVSIVFAMMFGITFYNNSNAPEGSHMASMFAMFFFGLSQCLQAYNRHVVRGENFISFAGADS